ncbi:MAG TPA: 16S rRNA (cytosine(1402)-N(4))-methyltransferase RsmH [Gemmataceae bacterium]|nr:16S rRNA (cytosine(1402)-N(4))-methyltransferase RsmH [Gemmataceae bacterium]
MPPQRRKPLIRRSTPAGEHRPVLLDEGLAVLNPQPGDVAVDCTLGLAGHSVPVLERVGPTGKLIGLDWDLDQLPIAREKLKACGLPFSLHHSNFAALPTILASEGIDKVDLLLADLGMSSRQVDNPDRGFSYVRDGPLDMRMDRSHGRTAAEILETISEPDLVNALRDLGDEPEAEIIARALVNTRQSQPFQRTGDVAKVIGEVVGQPTRRETGWRLRPARNQWQSHPAARTFQALRLLVNRELANLEHLLRILPQCLKAGGRAAIISFHSGEDRMVKTAFRQGLQTGVYQAIAPEPIRASAEEKISNPRSRSAKLRWARVKN